MFDKQNQQLHALHQGKFFEKTHNQILREDQK